MKTLCKTYVLNSLFKVLTNQEKPYPNQEKSSSINLLLTNRPKSFQISSAVETGLSDFHKMTVTIKMTTVLQISTSQRSINANLRSLTAHIYHVIMIIATGGFS